jgi:hypothetical protein
VRLLLRHLGSPRFISAMRALSYLDDDLAGVVRLHVLQRHPIRRAAAALGLTLHQARRQLAVAEGFIYRRGRTPTAMRV